MNEMKIETLRELQEKLMNDGEIYNLLTDGNIFRGEGNCEWKLLPGLFRESNFEEVTNLSGYGTFSRGSTYSDICVLNFYEMEVCILRKFAELCHEQGFEIGRIEYQRDEFNLITLINNYESEDIMNAITLAQHYGLPTRLIDWSFNIYIALYFAFWSMLKNNYNCKYMTIWVLNINKIKEIIPDSLKFIIPSYKNNPNIRAQKGVLSYWNTDKVNSYNNYAKESLEISISKKIESINKSLYKKKEYELTKIYLNKEICYKGIEWLETLGYKTSTIFPGYEGVVKHLKNELQKTNYRY